MRKRSNHNHPYYFPSLYSDGEGREITITKTIIIQWESLSFPLHHYIQSASRLMQGIAPLGRISAPFLQDPLSERRFRLQE